jgi:hypothetical protein
MPWFRLDDSFHSHPKVIAAGNEAVGLYVRCGTYCAQHLTDGFIPEQVMLLYGSSELAETLVRTKLLRRVRGGWRMPDFLLYNPSGQQVANEREAKTERQRRWREKQGKSNSGNAAENPVDNSGSNGHGEWNGRSQPRGRHRVDASTEASRDASRDGAPTPARPAPKEAGRAPGHNANGRASPPGSPIRVVKPSWCGECDEKTRLTGDPPRRCPDCHPLASAS